jgi:hypothetical protein
MSQFAASISFAVHLNTKYVGDYGNMFAFGMNLPALRVRAQKLGVVRKLRLGRIPYSQTPLDPLAIYLLTFSLVNVKEYRGPGGREPTQTNLYFKADFQAFGESEADHFILSNNVKPSLFVFCCLLM